LNLPAHRRSNMPLRCARKSLSPAHQTELAMKFTRDEADDNPEINIISLIDVILVLLIFFMATATFEQQAQLKLNLPQAADTQIQTDRSAALTVQVAEDGRYFVSSNEVNGSS